LASLIRKYLFTYYPKNSTVEMVSLRVRDLKLTGYFSLI
jgi:hypothetical protein